MVPPTRGGLKTALIESTAAGIVIQGSLLVSGVLLARALGPEQRGFFATFVLWPQIIYQFGGLGLPGAIAYAISVRPGAAHATCRLAFPTAVVQAVALTALYGLFVALVL